MCVLVQRAKLTLRMLGSNDMIEFNSAYKRGVHAAYRQLDSKWGFKFFALDCQRDENYRDQKWLHQHGITPAVGEKFDAIDRYGRKVFGYITEHVDRVFCKLSYDEQHVWWNAREELDKTCHKLMGCAEMDLHNNNIGLTKDGRLLVIDVSYKTNYDDERRVPEFYLLEFMNGGYTPSANFSFNLEVESLA